MKAGCAKVVITPSSPMRQAGYANRLEKAQKVIKDLYLRAIYFENGVTILSADLLWWNPHIMEKLKVSFDCSKLLFTATHNHSAPGTGNSFTPLLEEAEEEYQEFILSRVEEVLSLVKENAEEVKPYYGKTEVPLAVYRRVVTDQGVRMDPNYSVYADTRLTRISFKRADGSIKASLYHYPCHANLANQPIIHGDWPGYAMEMLEQDGSVSLFLQGCTGDLRPNAVLGAKFVPVDTTLVEQFAKQFYQATEAISDIALEDSVSSLINKDIALKLDQDFTKEDVEKALSSQDRSDREWAEKVLEKGLRDSEILHISALNLASIPICFYSAEMVQSYSFFFRKKDDRALSVGYTNGMTGYIANQKQIQEGGYESRGSAKYFALAGTFEEKIEEQIKKAITILSEEVKNDRR